MAFLVFIQVVDRGQYRRQVGDLTQLADFLRDEDVDQVPRIHEDVLRLHALRMARIHVSGVPAQHRIARHPASPAVVCFNAHPPEVARSVGPSAVVLIQLVSAQQLEAQLLSVRVACGRFADDPHHPSAMGAEGTGDHQLVLVERVAPGQVEVVRFAELPPLRLQDLVSFFVPLDCGLRQDQPIQRRVKLSAGAATGEQRRNLLGRLCASSPGSGDAPAA